MQKDLVRAMPYQSGDSVGPYGIIMIEREMKSDGRYSRRAAFQCPSCKKGFVSDVYTISSGKKRYCNDCAYQQRKLNKKERNNCQPRRGNVSYLTGDFVGPDNLEIIERKRNARGQLLPKATFVCPNCQKQFEADVYSVARGIKKVCNECSSQRIYKVGEYYGPNHNMLLLELAPRNTEPDLWECPYCGKAFRTRRSDIHRGTQSCGCYRAKCSSERFTKDLTGRDFGRLHVLGIDTEYENLYRDSKNPGTHIWLCQCSCGNIAHVRGSLLHGGAYPKLRMLATRTSC